MFYFFIIQLFLYYIFISLLYSRGKENQEDHDI